MLITLTRLLLVLVFGFAFIGTSNSQPSEPELSLGSKRVIESVTYALPMLAEVPLEDFRDTALGCVARNLSFDAFVGRDSSGSFVGAYSGRYYQTENTTVIAGTDSVVLHASDVRPLVIARARQDIPAVFDQTLQLTVALDGESGGKIVFENIMRAQNNTGSNSNTGFNPVYRNWGAGYKKVLEGIDDIADKLMSCMETGLN